jgi:hypothetical protein
MKEETTYLLVGENYRVSRDDDRNLLLEHKRIVNSSPNRFQTEKKSVEKWVNAGFFSTLQQALRRVMREEISHSLNGQLRNVIDAIDDTKQEILDAVADAGIKLESFPKAADGRGRKSVEVAKVDSEVKVTTTTSAKVPA